MMNSAKRAVHYHPACIRVTVFFAVTKSALRTPDHLKNVFTWIFITHNIIHRIVYTRRPYPTKRIINKFGMINFGHDNERYRIVIKRGLPERLNHTISTWG